MSLWGGGLRKRFSVAAFLLDVAQLSPLFLSLHHSPYAIGIPAAVALVLNPRMGGFVYILRLWGPFKQCPEIPAVSSTAPTCIGVYTQKLWECLFLALEPWAVWSGLGLWSFSPKVSVLICMWIWDCPLHHHCCLSAPQGISMPLGLWVSTPSYPSGWMWLLQVLGCWTSIQFEFLRLFGVIVFAA